MCLETTTSDKLHVHCADSTFYRVVNQKKECHSKTNLDFISIKNGSKNTDLFDLISRKGPVWFLFFFIFKFCRVQTCSKRCVALHCDTLSFNSTGTVAFLCPKSRSRLRLITWFYLLFIDFYTYRGKCDWSFWKKREKNRYAMFQYFFSYISKMLHGSVANDVGLLRSILMREKRLSIIHETRWFITTQRKESSCSTKLGSFVFVFVLPGIVYSN